MIHKRPLEKIQIQTTYNQAAKPDVLGTLVAQLVKPLGGLTLGSDLTGALSAVQAATSAKVPNEIISREFLRHRVPGKVTPAPPDEQKVKERADFDSALAGLGDRQEAATSALSKAKDVMNDINAEVAAAQKYPPVIEGEQWNGDDKAKFDQCVEHILARIEGKSSKPESATTCEKAHKPDVREMPLALPEVEVVLLKSEVADLPKSLAKLDADVKGSSAEITPDERQSYLKLIAALTVREGKVEDYMKTLQTTRDTLNGYRDVLIAWQAEEAREPVRMVIVTKVIKTYGAPAKSGQQTASAKVTAQTLLTKDSSDVGTVAVTFAHQPWEVSGGIMYSTVLGRSFQNSPVINAGVPLLDTNGKQVTAVTDATTKPTIDALVLVHWRFCEWQWSDSRNRRFAVLGSVGVGTGTNGSGADFAAGLSFAYGSFFLSPLLHFTRDQRLTNGVTLGQNLMGTSPPTERYWVHKLGLALTYAVPIS